jgi:REP element-mobilizing transposase RayT
MVERWWHELARKFQAVATDEFIVMPNHFHGIIVIVGADLRVGPTTGGHTGPPVPRSSLPEIIQWFKTMTTNEYIRAVKQNGWPPFPGKLWQRNYYEHVVRGAGDLNRIRAYIQSNPARWAQDRNYPFG